jgi:hypothetical protein
LLNSSLKNAHILIIDDQESNIASLESVLEGDGYTDLKSTTELRQHADDLALINELNVAINRGEDLQKIIILMSAELHRIFHCLGTMTAVPNPDKESMHIQHIEFPSPVANQIEKLTGASIGSIPLKIPMVGNGQFAQVMRAGTPKAINNADTIKAVMAEYTENKLLKSLVSPVYKLLEIGSWR